MIDESVHSWVMTDLFTRSDCLYTSLALALTNLISRDSYRSSKHSPLYDLVTARGSEATVVSIVITIYYLVSEINKTVYLIILRCVGKI